MEKIIETPIVTDNKTNFRHPDIDKHIPSVKDLAKKNGVITVHGMSHHSMVIKGERPTLLLNLLVNKHAEVAATVIYPNNPDVDLFAQIDGWNVLAPNWKTCIQCPQLDSSFEIKDFVPPVFLNEPILFTAFGKGRSSSFLLDNWSFSEAWGTWSNGTESSLRLPIPAGHPKTLTISARALVNGVHPSQDMKIMVNGVFVKQVHLTKNDENKITIPILENALSQGNMLIEFKFLNPIKPKDLDMGNDDRLLSIGIKSVVFN